MAYVQMTYRSRVLGLDTKINVILPYDCSDAEGNPLKIDKVLYLLHGLKQNADAWPRHSSAEVYAAQYGFAVVCPEVHRYWYADMPEGTKYFTYITEELPEIMEQVFHLPRDPKKTYVAGLSMGGYGALKCALRRPDLYAGAMCFSSGFYALERPEWLHELYHPWGELRSIMGNDFQVRDEDSIDRMIEAFPADAPKPKLYLACGTEDFLWNDNTRCCDTLRAHGFDLTWEQWPGAHEWRFWDLALDRSMKLMSE